MPPPTRKTAVHVPRELTELMFDSTSDGVFAVDAERRLIAFNRAAELTLGVTRAEVLGRPCAEVLRTSICRHRCAMEQAVETGSPVVNLPADLLDAHDRHVPVTLSSSILRGPGGQVIGCVESFRNMNWVRKLLRDVEHSHPFAGITSNCPRMRRLFAILPTYADSESSVLIEGETGTGKSLIARAVHSLSPRREMPFITINCGALPETLLESELFGYKAGAFTGAARDRIGRIAAAEGGTIFLDEIGDMSPSMQVKLLRFLQGHVYERLGDPQPIHADVRVVAATNRDLERLVEEGGFRRDLYYRINVLSLELPPLRERQPDIPLLAQSYLERLSMTRGKHVAGISPDTMAELIDLDYPGNIRELENIIEHAFVLSPGPVVGLEHLPAQVRAAAAARTRPDATRRLDEVQGQVILEALDRNGWNRTNAARELGVHKTTLLRQVRKLGLRLPETDGRSGRRK